MRSSAHSSERVRNPLTTRTVNFDPNHRAVSVNYAEVFEPLLVPRRYKGAKGGRGGAKSHFFAEYLIEQAVSDHTRVACLRETQNSIRDSVKQLLEDKIAKMGVDDLFDVTEQEIICPSTDSLFVFRGLRKITATSIKSMEGFTRAWYEEAQALTQRSLDMATPTFRTRGSEQYFSWNPNEADDPVDVFFRENEGDPDFACVEANWYDNPWFHDSPLYNDMMRDRRRDYDKYLHIWEGHYLKNSEARVFKNWRVEPFISPEHTFFNHGADWGFSIDPTVLVRNFFGRWEYGRAVPDQKGDTLFIDHEAYQVGVDIDKIPDFFDRLVKLDRDRPDLRHIGAARGFPIIADSSNPQAISYLRRNRYPKIRASVKGAGSIKEGVKFLQGYDIVVHPRCKRTIDELNTYLYMIDEKTNLVTNELPKKKNHVIDALRYSVEPYRRAIGTTKIGTRSNG